MSIFSALGGLLGKVAPIASLIPGVGSLFGAGAGLASSLLGGNNGGGEDGGGSGGGGGGLASKLLGAAPGILAGLGALKGAKQQNQGLDMYKQAMQGKQQQWQALQPLRDKAIQQAQAGAPKAQNLYNVFHDPTNPFSGPDRSPNQPPAPPPMVPSQPPPSVSQQYPLPMTGGGAGLPMTGPRPLVAAGLLGGPRAKML